MLHTKAAKDVPLVEMVLLELRAAQPAPLVVTSPTEKDSQDRYDLESLDLRASDMITSALFSLCARLALWTVREVLTGLRILEEISLCFSVVLFTAFPLVPRLATLEAHLEVTR